MGTPSDPPFVLTADLDWASEACIEGFVDMAARAGIEPTLFVTHRSAAVERFAREGVIERGIHPNFLPGTTHGEGIEAVLDHVLALVPDPVATRSHAFFDNSHVAAAVARRGIAADSNICCHLQADLRGLRHWTGAARLPVFFEDDCHWTAGHRWRFGDHESVFASTGLKILNVHPFMWALNAPDAAFYARHKRLIPSLSRADIRDTRHAGPGCATFLAEVIRWVAGTGRRFAALSEVVASVRADLCGDAPSLRRA